MEFYEHKVGPHGLSRPDRTHYEMIMKVNAGASNLVLSFVKEPVVIITHKYM